MNPEASTFNLRSATPEDVPHIHALIGELAAFENLRDRFVSTPADFHRALFSERPAIEALVADAPPDSPSPLAGTALFFQTFSTFTGKPGLWLEDVYVRPEYRGQGLGKAFLERFLALARERHCGRAEWSVLDWNEHAIHFYENLGATILPDWRICRVEI